MDPLATLVDTNVPLTASTPDRRLHQAALAVLNEWPSAGVPLALSGQIIREYLVVATRPRPANGLGLGPAEALENVAAFRSRMRELAAGEAASERLLALVARYACRGKQIHDANLVATALAHGVRRLVTANPGDFVRFGGEIEVLDLAAFAT